MQRGESIVSPALAGALRRALDAGELVAYFQPQYEMSTGRLAGVEALSRWQHPDGRVLTPHWYLPSAEHFGLIREMDAALLADAGAQVARWRGAGTDVSLSINVSPSELGASFAVDLVARAREAGLGPGALTVEITEAPVIPYARAEVEALDTLLAQGVGVAIDDFGIGNTSLDILRRVPLSEVKIDRSLVQSGDPAAGDLARACVEVARDRGARVVAEGIESRAQWERARDWGCERAQGYLLSPPLPAAEVERLLRRESLRERGQQ
jgi:EAL domain-containing protein (putative c-di-GMP-specific phosphodiesterase class I)